MTNEMVTVSINGRCKCVPRGTLLSEALEMEKPCGGHGRCGKCVVTVSGDLSEITVSEKAHLTESELCSGKRLACMTSVLGDCEVEIDQRPDKTSILTDGRAAIEAKKTAFKKYGIAIDLGTTTLAARLYDRDGVLLGTATSVNSQVKWGSDVLSRVEAAIAGMSSELSRAIKADICAIIATLADISKISTGEVDSVVITGNTAMLSILVNESVEPFSHAPFVANRLFGETVCARDVGLGCLSAEASVYFPPCISAFVGADLTCAVMATELYNKRTAMLIDIGTNGELALFFDGRLIVTSMAAGPAFEGVGISCGMRGEPGAIDRVSVCDGRLKAHVIGDVKAIGLCGSGLVDAVAALLELGTLDESGYLEGGTAEIVEGVNLTQKDIRMLQLAKAAVCAGAGVIAEGKAIPRVYIAGGFGSYLDRKNASRIGLLPVELSTVAVTVGNAALDGASMLLLDPDAREVAEALARGAKSVNLSESRAFSDMYASSMIFTEIFNM